MPRLCCHVSGHGFGHSARVQAVVEELLRSPDWEVEIRTSAPRRFHEWLLGPRCRFTAVDLDPGVVQHDSYRHDLPATLVAWRELLDRAPELIEREAAYLRDGGFDVVLADIVPLALSAAAAAGLPGLLLTNFTWDWILGGLATEEPGLAGISSALEEHYRRATTWLRLPMSHDSRLFAEERILPFVARHAHRPAEEVRSELGLRPEERMVLLSFGGFGIEHLGLSEAARQPGLRCVWDRPESEPPWLLSVAGAGLHYPDLIGATDLILTKPGYSIIAEAVAQRTPLAYAPRPGYPETGLLVGFLEECWPSLRLEMTDLTEGTWPEKALTFLKRSPEAPTVRSDGAADVVREIEERVARGEQPT